MASNYSIIAAHLDFFKKQNICNNVEKIKKNDSVI
jgi:hypothetical protein